MNAHTDHHCPARRTRLVPFLAAMLFALAVVAAGSSHGDDAPPNATGASVQPPAAEVIAERVADDLVEIKWRVREWEKEQVGFELTRRSVAPDGTQGEPQRVGPRPIQPNFSDAWLKQHELDRVIQQKPGLKQDRIDTLKIVARFKAEPKELQIIAGICESDIQWATAFGFGWVDRQSDATQTYEYSLARVYRDHLGFKTGPAIAIVTLAKGRTVIPAPKITDLTASRGRQPGLVRLNWQIAADELRKHKVHGFGILRGDPEGPLNELVGTVNFQLGQPAADGKTVAFTYGDAEAGEKARKYAVAFLDRRLKPGTTSAPVAVRKLGGELTAPKAIKAELTDEGVRITWEHGDAVGTFAGFVVRRVSDLGTPAAALNTQPLPTGRRFYLDKTALQQAGKALTYSVWALSGDERQSRFSPPVRVQVPYPKPPTPKDFKARVFLKDQQLHCQFTVTEATAPGVDAYEVRQLMPQTQQWMEIGTVPSGHGGGTFSFTPVQSGKAVLRCATVTKDNKRSELSEEVYVLIPSTQRPSIVQSFRVKSSKSAVEFTWRAPMSDTIKGYRIYADGELLADEKVLTSATRSWSTSDLPWVRHEYTIVQVDISDQVSDAKIGGEIGKLPPRKPVADKPQPQDTGHAEAIPDGARPQVERKFYDDDPAKPWRVRPYLVLADGKKVKHGTWVNYYESGKVSVEMPYHVGKLNGVSRYYAEDGTIQKLVFSAHGQKMSYGEYIKERGQSEITEADKAWVDANP